MTALSPEPRVSFDPGATEWKVGGMCLSVAFRREDGATLRVFGPTAGGWVEMLRFDDFLEGPHYHVPAEAEPIMFDRAGRGEPLEFFVTQIRDHLGELLEEAGFSELLPGFDLAAVSADAERVRAAMVDCVPDGYRRVPGFGLTRVTD